MHDPGRRKLEFCGEVHTIYTWAKITGISVKAICMRLNRDWSIEDALLVPIGERRKNYARPCHKCVYGVYLMGYGHACYYIKRTGHSRVFENGKKVDKCPYIKSYLLEKGIDIHGRGKDCGDKEQAGEEGI